MEATPCPHCDAEDSGRCAFPLAVLGGVVPSKKDEARAVGCRAMHYEDKRESTTTTNRRTEMTDQEKNLFWAIFDAIGNEATRQQFFMCRGHSAHWEGDLRHLVDKILDTKCHGRWRDDSQSRLQSK